MAMTIHCKGCGIVGDTWDVQAVGVTWGDRDREFSNWGGHWRGDRHRVLSIILLTLLQKRFTLWSVLEIFCSQFQF